MGTQALAQLVSTRLYHRRFFPYDAVGSFERSTCGVQGSGVSLIQPPSTTSATSKTTLQSQTTSSPQRKWSTSSRTPLPRPASATSTPETTSTSTSSRQTASHTKSFPSTRT